MAKTITGRLVRDARLIDGKESDGGRLHLRGETVTVELDFAELVDTKPRRTKRKPSRRAAATNKQATPDATKEA